MGAFLVCDGRHDVAKEHHISEPRINDRIRVPEVRLVGPNGEQVGIVRIEQALTLAQEADLDLVEVAPQARPPDCKLMDFGKYKYESDMKAREARRNQAHTVLKEIRLRLKIDPHDYGTKKGHVERFLKAGDKVKVMIMFRGREQSRPEMGYRLLQRMAADVADLGFIESKPKQDGRNMIMVIGPHKKKAEAKAELKKRRDDGDVGDVGEEIEAPVEATDVSGTAGPPGPPSPHPHNGRPAGRLFPTARAPTRGADRRGEHGSHAEDEDAQRCEEALQDQRQRPDPARAGQPPPSVRRQDVQAHPQVVAGHRGRIDRRREDQAPARQVSRPPFTKHRGSGPADLASNQGDITWHA